MRTEKYPVGVHNLWEKPTGETPMDSLTSTPGKQFMSTPPASPAGHKDFASSHGPQADETNQNTVPNLPATPKSINSSDSRPSQSSFVQKLRTSSRDESVLLSATFDTFYKEHKKITVITSEDTKYTLEPSLDMYSQNLSIEPSDTYCCELVWDQNEEQRKAAESQSNELFESCFFALGWLVEQPLQKPSEDSKRRVTKYIVMLDISRDPMSLWLVYDYNIMGPRGVHELYKGDENALEVYFPSWYDDDDDDDMEGLDDGIENLDDSDNRSIGSPNQPASTSISIDDDNSPMIKLDKGPEYFLIPESFDFGCISDNINEWDTESGLDPSLWRASLTKKHYKKGKSLWFKPKAPSTDDSQVRRSSDVKSQRA